VKAPCFLVVVLNKGSCFEIFSKSNFQKQSLNPLDFRAGRFDFKKTQRVTSKNKSPTRLFLDR
jgi:hypothetical protein